jgi:hypothetical protein
MPMRMRVFVDDISQRIRALGLDDPDLASGGRS